MYYALSLANIASKLEAYAIPWLIYEKDAETWLKYPHGCKAVCVFVMRLQLFILINIFAADHK